MIQTHSSAGIAQNPLLCPVIFEKRNYYGVKEFDGKIIHLFTEPTLQGTFMTVIPISPLEYRKKNSTKAKVEVIEDLEWTNFIMTDDWGEKHTIQLHNSLSYEIAYAKKMSIENGLL
jgi:hypothetical protein